MPNKKLMGWPGLQGKELQFVILRHTESNQEYHYDLLFELRPGTAADEKTLWGFKRRRLPKKSAHSIRWHTHGKRRRRYLTFEGDIGKQRGVVQQVDHGLYTVRKVKKTLTLLINGRTLRGQFYLQRASPGVHIWLRSPTS